MNGMLYLLQVNIYLVAFYAFYRLFLSGETFFSLNRFYLLISTLLSFGIPVLQSDWLKNWLAPTPVQDLAVQINLQAYEFLYVPKGEVANISLGDLLSWLYIGVAGLLSLRLIYHIIGVYRLMSNPQNGLQACSFFNYLSVNDDLEGREAIMVHEQVHVRQLHSADILFFEIHAIINWFNPVAYLLKNEIRKVHEYIADVTASETLPEKSAYAMLLLHQKFGITAQKLTNSFFNQSILKQRIMMLQKNKSKRRALWKYGFTAPLFLGMLIISSAFVSEKTVQTQKVLETEVISDSISTKNGKANNPIYIVNGKIMSPEDAKKIDANNIESIKVIKGKDAQNKYGVRAVEGAMEISLTKEGNKTNFVNDSIKVIYLPKKQAEETAPVLKINGEKGKGGTIEVLPNKVKNETEKSGEKPLIVMDGKVMEAGFDMNSIKPTDIASISILKDKSATSAYGEKAKNGVVQITLKKKN